MKQNPSRCILVALQSNSLYLCENRKIFLQILWLTIAVRFHEPPVKAKNEVEQKDKKACTRNKNFVFHNRQLIYNQYWFNKLYRPCLLMKFQAFSSHFYCFLRHRLSISFPEKLFGKLLLRKTEINYFYRVVTQINIFSLSFYCHLCFRPGCSFSSYFLFWLDWWTSQIDLRGCFIINKLKGCLKKINRTLLIKKRKQSE